jgi:hypothetical protein
MEGLTIGRFALGLLVVGFARERSIRSFLIGVLAVAGAHGATAFANPQNAGFEDGVLDGAPIQWNVDAANANDVVVVNTEDGSEFAIYGDLGIEVAALRGDNCPDDSTSPPELQGCMLRVGTPENPGDQDNNQSDGITIVSQEFIAESDQLRLSTWIFSTEFRTRRDSISFRLVGANGDAFSISDVDGGAFEIGQGPSRQSCTTTPCTLPLDAGNNGDVLNTGWVEYVISGLTVGETYTLSYELATGGGASHPSWAYFDDANLPPTADFIYAPGNGVANSKILEGDLITLLSEAEDPNGDPMTLTWFFDTGDPCSPTFSAQPDAEGAVGLTAFPQDGSYTVWLKADDGQAAACTNRTIVVDNAPPLIQPLTVEVATNRSGRAVCNWLDPGIEDDVEVTITLPGFFQSFPSTTPNREAVPALASGQEVLDFVAADDCTGVSSCLEPGVYRGGGECAVTDDTTTTTVAFDVVVLSDTEIDAREASDTDSTLNTPLVMANSATVGRLGTANGGDPADIDVYRVCLPHTDFEPSAALATVGDCDTTRVSDIEIQQLPSKSKVVITLDSPDADYDLLAFVSAEEETPFKNAPFIGAPFIGAPFIGADFENAPFIGAAFGSLPFIGAPFIGAPFIGAPFIGAPFIGANYRVSPFIGAGADPSDPSTWVINYRNVPRTELFGVPDGSVISGVDTNYIETGSENLRDIPSQRVQFVGLSANIDGQEQLVVEVNPAKSLYLVVTATNGSATSTPYTLTNQVSVPVDPKRTFGALCDGSLPAYIPADDATSIPEVVYPSGVDDGAAGYTTYILTQRQRFQKAYGLTDEDWAVFIEELAPYLEAVDAKVVSLPSTWFDAADQSICDVAAQNVLAEDIRDYLQTQLNAAGADTVQYVQLLGSYQVIPPRYVPEETTILNESLYAPDLLTTPSPLSFAYGLGHNAIDSYYTTFDPIPYRGRFLYVEDVSISRLLETPAEILATTLGQLKDDPSDPSAKLAVLEDFAPDGGIVTDLGYDFFRDATQETAANFAGISGILSGASLNSDSLLDPLGGSWTADDFRCYILGADVPGCLETEAPEISVANFHASHNACLPARDFEDGAAADDFSGAEIVRADEVGQTLVGKLFTGIGCHSLLSVADSWVPVEIGNLDLPVSLAGDWAQQPGTKIGPQGFGSGHDEQLRGSELVATLQAEEMANGHAAGPALVRAKQRYVASLVEVSPNDEDAVINHTISGVAQAKIAGTPNPPVSATGGSSNAVRSLAVASFEGAGFAGGQLELTIFEDGVDEPFPYTPSLVRRTDHPEGWGEWWTLDGVASAITNRTLLPRYTPADFDFRLLSKTPDVNWIHGLVIRERDGFMAGRYVDRVMEDAAAPTDGDPVFPVEKHDWIKKVLEPQPCVETLGPTQLASAGVFRTRGEARQTLSIVGAQFRCRPGFAVSTDRTINGRTKSVAETRGDWRVFTGLTFQALRPLDVDFVNDFEPPEVISQQFVAPLDSTDVQATVRVRDSGSGMRGIIFLIYRPVDCADPVASADFGAECAEGRAGYIDAEEVLFDSPYPTGEVTGSSTLIDGKGKLFAVQYFDAAGNVTSKSLKGTLQRALAMNILNTFISLSNSDLRVFIEDLVNLNNVIVTTSVWQGTPDDGEEPLVTTYELNDPAIAGLFEIDQLTSTLTLFDLNLGGLTEETVTIAVTVQAVGAYGQDTATIGPCSDAIDDVVDTAEQSLQGANFVGCGFRSEGTRVFIEMEFNDLVSDEFQYRAELEGFDGSQIKLNDLTKLSGPPGSQPGFSIDGNRLVLHFDAASVGWDGQSPLTIVTETQAGVKGKQEAGFIDQMVFPGEL